MTIIRHTCSPRLALNQFLHTHSQPDCGCATLYPPALFPRQFCICSLHVSLGPVCSLPVLPLRTLLPHSELKLCSLTRLPDCCLFGLLNIVNKVLNCSGLDLYCSCVQPVVQPDQKCTQHNLTTRSLERKRCSISWLPTLSRSRLRANKSWRRSRATWQTCEP